MNIRKHSEEELYEIAEQILLKEKEWSDFDGYLSDDDKGKIVAIVRRGMQALSEQKKRFFHEKRMVSAQQNLQRRTGRGNYVNIPEKKRVAIGRLAKRVGFDLFPVDPILKEQELVQRKFMEALNRRLSPADVALLFTHVIHEEGEPLLHAVSRRLAEEIQFHKESLPEDVPAFEVDLIAARFSMAAAAFFADCEEASQAIQEFNKQYVSHLRKHLEEYCQKLPERLGLLTRLENLDKEQWVKLAGLTPRRELANMAMALPKDIIQKIMLPLPNAQREDVEQLVAHMKEERKKHLKAYADTIDSLKHWILIIDKVKAVEEED